MDLLEGDAVIVTPPETLTRKRRRRSADSPAAGGPRWVILSPDINTSDSSNPFCADGRTAAASCTSSGLHFGISCGLEAAPAISTFHCHWQDDAVPSDGKYPDQLHVIAAHDDLALIKMCMPRPIGVYDYTVCYDYFLYEAGGAARPPLLSLLPRCYMTNQSELQQDPTPSRRTQSFFDANSTGVLRRGKGKFLVVQLCVLPSSCDTAELCVLRSGCDNWVIKRVPVVVQVQDNRGEGHYQVGSRIWWQHSKVEAAVPVGNRFMCWVDYRSGFFLCDMGKTKKNPKLRFLPLPVLAAAETMLGYYYNTDDQPRDSHCLAAAGPDAVRFVAVAPRCCCGGAGKTSCERSRNAFKVTTWTMNVRATEEQMTWVKDRVLDCDEVWQHPNYGDLQRGTLTYPVVSSDDPDVVCFTVDASTVVINKKARRCCPLFPAASMDTAGNVIYR